MLLAASPLAPGSCVGVSDWCLTVAAPGQSTLAGILTSWRGGVGRGRPGRRDGSGSWPRYRRRSAAGRSGEGGLRLLRVTRAHTSGGAGGCHQGE